MQHSVLITRPEPGAAEMAQQVAALGWQPVLAPALTLVSLPPAHLPAAQALVLASRGAARALPATPRPVFVVGAGTAAEARARGCPDVTAAEGDAASLAALIARRLDPGAGPLLLAVGQGYGAELAAALRGAGFRVIRRVVYAARPATALPDPARDALAAGHIGHALFLSPRSAAIACGLIRAAGMADAMRGIEALALSPRIAAALAPLPWRAVRVTARPDPALLLALLGRAPAGSQGPRDVLDP
jgi:uroporphyrinogen-III synthase